MAFGGLRNYENPASLYSLLHSFNLWDSKAVWKSQGTILHRFACHITFAHNLLIFIHNLNENIVKHDSSWRWKSVFSSFFQFFAPQIWYKDRGNLKKEKCFGRQIIGIAKQNNMSLYLGVIFFKKKLTAFICKNLLVTKGRGQKQIPGNLRNSPMQQLNSSWQYNLNRWWDARWEISLKLNIQKYLGIPLKTLSHILSCYVTGNS